ncbi:MBL fold metallo-hydrolase [bacterium]|nr:MBL fold metallo-hydrolase [bacterium]
MTETLHIISSGSKANSYIIQSEEGSILIDQGLSFKQFKCAAEGLGVDLSDAIAILVTHEHIDHIRGVAYTACKLGIPIFSTSQTLQRICSDGKYTVDTKSLLPDKPFRVGKFLCTAFSTVHDAADPVGFFLEMPSGESFCLATDTGMVTNRMLSYFNRCEHLILEANHDVEMLYKNPHYPPDLKRRIHSKFGHLSNESSIDALSRLERHPKTVIFAHLSEENNTPVTVKTLVRDFKKSSNADFKAFIAYQNAPYSIKLN